MSAETGNLEVEINVEDGLMMANTELLEAWISSGKANSVSDKADGVSWVASGLPGLALGYLSYLEALTAKSKPKSGWEADEEVFG
jgi:hypothetical protein